MKAALFHSHGDPSVLTTGELPDPEPGPGEVRIEVRAAALNHLDLWVRRGLIEVPLPHVGGSDMAGVVESVGTGVDPSLVGLRVVVDPSLDYEAYDGTDRGPDLPRPSFRLLGEHTHGGFAERAVVPADNLLQLPDEVAFETAAAAGLVTVTAWRALIHRGGLRAGESVLVTGGSGGVSTVAVQIAREAGAVVHAVTSGPENVTRVRELGAHEVVDRLEEDDLAAWVRGVTGGRGVDLVLDSVGEALWSACVDALARGGRLVSYGATTGATGETSIRKLFWKQLSLVGSTMGTPAQYREAMDLVFRGRVEPPVQEVLPLDELRRAHELLEEGRVFGKLVLTP